MLINAVKSLNKISLVTYLLLFIVPVSFAENDGWSVPRLPWGEPDLQGTWSTATLTTLERSDGQEDLVVSDTEAQHLVDVALGITEDEYFLPEGDLPAGDFVGGYNREWSDPGTHLLRVKGEARTSIVVEPADGKVPYTLWAKGQYWWELLSTQKRNNPEELLLGDRCVVGFGSSGGPPMLPVVYNNNYQFIQSPGHVAILVEMNHAVRNIRIGGKPLPKVMRPWLGDSIGHWDGDTLVVETQQFHPQQSMRAASKHRLLMTTDTKVIERFTRLNEKEIHYEFTVEDEEIYTQPWRGELTFRPTEGEIYEYACHEGNYALPGILEGERKTGSDGLAWLINILSMPEL